MNNHGLQDNQHLNRQQVLETFSALAYPTDNIISSVNVEEFQGAEICNEATLRQAINMVMEEEGNKNNRLILLRVNAQTRGFVEMVEGENNHYVALYFGQDEHGLRLTYIDPTGEGMSSQIGNIISSHEKLANSFIRSSKAVLQYTNPSYENGVYQMGGNDADCGVLVALAADRIRLGEASLELNEPSSRKLGQLIRQIRNGEKSLGDIDGVIESFVKGDVMEEALKNQRMIDGKMDELSHQIGRGLNIIDDRYHEDRKFVNSHNKLQQKFNQQSKLLSQESDRLRMLEARQVTLKQDLDASLQVENVQGLINRFYCASIAVIDAAMRKRNTSQSDKSNGEMEKKQIYDMCQNINPSYFISQQVWGNITQINDTVSSYKESVRNLTKVAYQQYSLAYEDITNIFSINKQIYQDIPSNKMTTQGKQAKHQHSIAQIQNESLTMGREYQKQQQEKENSYQEAAESLKAIKEQQEFLHEEQERSDQDIEEVLKKVENYKKQRQENEVRGDKIHYLTSTDKNAGYSLEVHQMDVGQGESALIICRNNQEIEWSVLLDAGENCNNNPKHILSYAQKHLGGKKLDAIIITHDDKDHHGSLIGEENSILCPIINYQQGSSTIFVTQDWSNRFWVNPDRTLGRGNQFNGSHLGQDIWQIMGKLKPHGAVPNMTCVAHGGYVKGKKGVKDLRDFLSGDHEKSTNDRSLGFVIEFGGFKFYSAGDLSSQIEDQIDIGKVSAFKAGHHGSKHSTSASLISSLQPRAAVISHGGRLFSTSTETHPNDIPLRNIDESSTIQTTYMTNPIVDNLTKDRAKAAFVDSNNKFIVAGRNLLLHSGNQLKTPRGDVCFRVTQQQSALNNVFFAEYERDYNYKEHHSKQSVIIDDFTNIESEGLEKITKEGLRNGENIAVESASRMAIRGLNLEEDGRVKGSLDNKIASLPEMSGRYLSKGDIYQTDNIDNPKTKVSKKDRLVLKLTTQSLGENRKFLKSLNPQGYDELMKNLPQEKRDHIELYSGEKASKIKVKAGNDKESSVTLSWIEKVGDRNMKNKLKVKSLTVEDATDERRFVDRISYTVSPKTK